MRLSQLLRPVLACLALAFLIWTLSAPAFAQASGSVGGAGAPVSRGYDAPTATTTPSAISSGHAVYGYDDRTHPSRDSLRLSRRVLATKGEDDLLGAARAARDKKAAEVGSSKATVTGGYDPATGKVVAGCNRNPFGCAEDDVARLLGIPDKDIRFTEAIRPRTGREVPVCRTCQGKYDRSQFPPGTRFDEP